MPGKKVAEKKTTGSGPIDEIPIMMSERLQQLSGLMNKLSQDMDIIKNEQKEIKQTMKEQKVADEAVFTSLSNTVIGMLVSFKAKLDRFEAKVNGEQLPADVEQVAGATRRRTKK